ncbi:hypothetical protein JKP88DRAFT_242027 [Tribonema minus]|uniref:Uncharacterized protein n=1 Tax=Tribonema minus TaxID=303371 RepID=A0A835YNT7_9STRA|nr:hypothetical protein JKP88DRAFT_242027 [Tribonema minus]
MVQQPPPDHALPRFGSRIMGSTNQRIRQRAAGPVKITMKLLAGTAGDVRHMLSVHQCGGRFSGAPGSAHAADNDKRSCEIARSYFKWLQFALPLRPPPRAMSEEGQILCMSGGSSDGGFDVIRAAAAPAAAPALPVGCLRWNHVAHGARRHTSPTSHPLIKPPALPKKREALHQTISSPTNSKSPRRKVRRSNALTLMMMPLRAPMETASSPPRRTSASTSTSNSPISNATLPHHNILRAQRKPRAVRDEANTRPSLHYRVRQASCCRQRSMATRALRYK